MGAQAGKLALAQVQIGVQLQGLTNEYEAHDAVDVECATQLGATAAGIVHVTTGGVTFDALDEAVDQAAGFILLGEAEAEASDCLGDVEALKVVLVVTALEQLLVELLASGVQQTLPDGIAFFGRTKGEQAQRRVGEPVLKLLFSEGLCGDGSRGEVDQVEAVEF